MTHASTQVVSMEASLKFPYMLGTCLITNNLKQFISTNLPPATLKFEYGYIYSAWGKSSNILKFDMLQCNKLTRKKKKSNKHLSCFKNRWFFTFLISLIKWLNCTNNLFQSGNYINDNSWNPSPVLYWIVKPKQFPPTLYDLKYFRYILHKDIKITPVLLSKHADRWIPI